MTVYLTIAAKRIQPWLVRTPRLVLIRGASRALAEVTGVESINQHLRSDPIRYVGVSCIAENGDNVEPGALGTTPEAGPGGAETGEIDGVVSVRVPTLADAPRVAEGLLTHLGSQLPGVEWECWWAESTTYLRAQDDYRHGSSLGSLQWIPLLQDCGLVEACLQCRREPAAPVAADRPHATESHRDGAHDGDECRTRRASSGQGMPQWRGARPEVFRPPGAFDEIPGEWAHDFDTLARLGGMGADGQAPASLGRKDSRNHLATIVADGNAMGALFDRIASPPSGVDTTDLAVAASVAVDRACQRAVIEAALAVSAPDAPTAVVEPHFLGGDDIFVTVPAPVAWRFIATMSSTFEEQLRGLAVRVPAADASPPDANELQSYEEQLRDALGKISLGVGVCFAHSTHPIQETHALAERAMKAAKRRGRGESSSIGWVDLTADVAASPYVVDLGTVRAELAEENWPDVFGLTPSARVVLSGILRDTAADETSLARWARRVGWRRGSSPTPRADLPALLSRARWFPGTADDDASPEETR